MHLANTVLMVEPLEFGFNTETSDDNSLQKSLDLPAEQIRDKAVAEFHKMVENLRANGVHVLVLTPEKLSTPTPDAVFPNNWLMTDDKGRVITMPMYSPNRRMETVRLDQALALFKSSGYLVNEVVKYHVESPAKQYLEGTGSMVIDYNNDTIFAASSKRTFRARVEDFTRRFKYKDHLIFRTQGSNGNPLYHTNVVMSIGMNFAVVCADAIPAAEEKQKILGLLRHGRTLINISVDKMEQHFCANILQLINSDGQPVIVMSDRAKEGFGKSQLRELEGCGKIVSSDIGTIETVGGGSARCMLAEVFLPRA